MNMRGVVRFALYVAREGFCVTWLIVLFMSSNSRFRATFTLLAAENC